MCGIAGLLNAPFVEADLRRMAAALRHRGPDADGFLVDGPLGFAHRRLSILDLSAAGHQPMPNEDGSVQVVYNGQLYGFEPLRARLEAAGHRFRSRTDTEVLVHLYEDDGERMVEAIDGMFAFALWDARHQRLLLARDRLGIKPLYWTSRDGRVAFASEVRALLALPWVDRGVDLPSVVQYLYQSSVPGTRSAYAGIRQVQPGEQVVFEGGTVRARRYWSPPEPTERAPPTFADAADELRERLAAAVRTHLVADVPVGAFLSGGLDSAAVTQAAVIASGARLHTFSVRFAGDPRLDEGPAARETAQALGTEHHELVLTDADSSVLPDVIRAVGEPFAIASGIALVHLARFARQRVKVVLTGDGADEILAGYPWRHEPERGSGLLRRAAMLGVRSVRSARAGKPSLGAQLASRARRLRRPSEHYAELVSAFTPEEMESLLAPDLAHLAREEWRRHPVRAAYEQAPAADEVNRRLRAELATTLVDEMLVKVDRTTMAAGLEARVPFLDRGFVEWALALPGRYKVRGGVGKRVLRAAIAPVFPAAAVRPKQGFTPPLGAWLRGSLREMVGDALSEESLRRRGWLRPEAVARLWAAHLDERGDYSRKLLTIAALEMWARETG